MRLIKCLKLILRRFNVVKGEIFPYIKIVENAYTDHDQPDYDSLSKPMVATFFFHLATSFPQALLPGYNRTRRPGSAYLSKKNIVNSV
jgi:hypothetical protein